MKKSPKLLISLGLVGALLLAVSIHYRGGQSENGKVNSGFSTGSAISSVPVLKGQQAIFYLSLSNKSGSAVRFDGVSFRKYLNFPTPIVVKVVGLSHRGLSGSTTTSDMNWSVGSSVSNQTQFLIPKGSSSIAVFARFKASNLLASFSEAILDWNLGGVRHSSSLIGQEGVMCQFSNSPGLKRCEVLFQGFPPR